ncbi:hypothetical protein PLICRDRAFT_34304 [Plicaturopsis crispa FD-325 SS-3]|nr:hypothetical protein PLICRDRAFT_34304 [Plicaturopsis crispa FD-325 SS-3]
MAILRDPPFHIAAPLNAATRLFSSPGRAETRKAVPEACTINVIDALTSQGARYVPISSASVLVFLDRFLAQHLSQGLPGSLAQDRASIHPYVR